MQALLWRQRLTQGGKGKCQSRWADWNSGIWGLWEVGLAPSAWCQPSDFKVGAPWAFLHAATLPGDQASVGSSQRAQLSDLVLQAWCWGTLSVRILGQIRAPYRSLMLAKLRPQRGFHCAR